MSSINSWRYIKWDDTLGTSSIVKLASLSSITPFRDGVLLGKCDHITLKKDEKWKEKTVRCRTIGDMTCTGVSESQAKTLEEIIDEVASTRITERGGRADDKRSEAAMEDRKKEGYF